MKWITITAFLILSQTSFTQHKPDWHHLDPFTDTVPGISTYKAFEHIKDKKADTVIVAIIDNGVDLTHKDLQGIFWINEDEIPGNGIDDDKNGYIDDIHGWNFLGNQKGKNLKRETTELTRYFYVLNIKYEDKSIEDIDKESRDEFKKYLQIKEEYEEEVKAKKDMVEYYEKVITYFDVVSQILNTYFKTTDYTESDVKAIESDDERLNAARDFMIKVYDNNDSREYFVQQVKNLKSDLETRLNPDFKNRQEIVGDDPDNIKDTIYGNNMLNVRGPYHGTSVAGIIGALDNDFGVTGIAKHVKLMIIRIIPNGDERDKDVALAIRYAVRNGADIINCSFGKKYSRHPEFVQNSIDEAERAGVLIIAGAGNSATNNDSIPYYPTGIKQNGQKASNFMTVGASSDIDNEKIVAFFSNYGKKSVDIFAPGVMIRSCALNNQYAKVNGTSASAPVVAGIAAVLKSCFPHLTAKDLKAIIMESAYIPNKKKVILPGTKNQIVDFSDLSVSGGIANLHRAIMLAEEKY